MGHSASAISREVAGTEIWGDELKGHCKHSSSLGYSVDSDVDGMLLSRYDKYYGFVNSGEYERKK